MNPRLAYHGQVVRPLLVALVVVLVGFGDAEAQRRKRRKKPRARPAAAAPAPTEPAAPTPGVNVPAGATDAPTPPTSPAKKGKDQVFDFTGIELAGSMRMPQLLYFLDRAEEELERAALERRSFVPEMVRSIDEEAL